MEYAFSATIWHGVNVYKVYIIRYLGDKFLVYFKGAGGCRLYNNGQCGCKTSDNFKIYSKTHYKVLF